MFYLWRDGTIVCGCKQQGKRRGRGLLERLVVLDLWGKCNGEPSRRLLVLSTIVAVVSTGLRRTFSPRGEKVHRGGSREMTIIIAAVDFARVSHGIRIFSFGKKTLALRVASASFWACGSRKDAPQTTPYPQLHQSYHHPPKLLMCAAFSK